MNRLALALVLFVAAPARADVAPAPERRLFTRLGAGAALDYESWHPDGGGLGVVAVTDVDTNLGANTTSWGWAVALHAGVERRVSARWAIGLLGRLTIYRFGTDTPPPSSTSTGVLPTLFVTLAR